MARISVLVEMKRRSPLGIDRIACIPILCVCILHDIHYLNAKCDRVFVQIPIELHNLTKLTNMLTFYMEFLFITWNLA